MVAAEVEEGRDVEDHAVDAAQDQGVARDLHRAGVDAVLRHHREEPVEVGRLGGGELGLDVLARDAGADGADDGRRHARGGEALLEEPRGGGLALGPGHPDDPHPARRVAVDRRGQSTEDAARLRHDDGRGARRQPVEAGRVGEHADGARLQRLHGEVGSVGAGAGEGGVHVTRLDARGAQRDAGHGDVEVAVPLEVGARGEPVGQLRERRRGHLLRARRDHGISWLVHRPSVSTHHSTGRRDGLPLVGSTP